MPSSSRLCVRLPIIRLAIATVCESIKHKASRSHLKLANKRSHGTGRRRERLQLANFRPHSFWHCRPCVYGGGE